MYKGLLCFCLGFLMHIVKVGGEGNRSFQVNRFKEHLGRGPQGRTENRKNLENFKN